MGLLPTTVPFASKAVGVCRCANFGFASAAPIAMPEISTATKNAVRLIKGSSIDRQAKRPIRGALCSRIPRVRRMD